MAEKLLLGPTDFGMEDFDDLKSVPLAKRQELQKKARKEQRRKSRQLIKSQVGSKAHFSDEDVQEDKPQRSALKARKKLKGGGRMKNMAHGDEDFDFAEKMKAAQMTNNKKRASFKAGPIINDEKKDNKHHRRDSSAPVIDLGFEDPEILLNFEKLKTKDLQKELEQKLNDLDAVKEERDALKREIDSGSLSQNKLSEVQQQSEAIETQLSEAIDSKAKLAQKCAMEIMRLTMILNTLQQMPKIKEIVQLLIDESAKDSNKNGSLLG